MKNKLKELLVDLLCNELFLYLIFFVVIISIGIGICKIEKYHCDKNGGKFILGYGDRNRCIYE